VESTGPRVRLGRACVGGGDGATRGGTTTGLASRETRSGGGEEPARGKDSPSKMTCLEMM
jgi:hypothetical protein